MRLQYEPLIHEVRRHTVARRAPRTRRLATQPCIHSALLSSVCVVAIGRKDSRTCHRAPLACRLPHRFRSTRWTWSSTATPTATSASPPCTTTPRTTAAPSTVRTLRARRPRMRCRGRALAGTSWARTGRAALGRPESRQQPGALAAQGAPQPLAARSWGSIVDEHAPIHSHTRTLASPVTVGMGGKPGNPPVGEGALDNEPIEKGERAYGGLGKMCGRPQPTSQVEGASRLFWAGTCSLDRGH